MKKRIILAGALAIAAMPPLAFAESDHTAHHDTGAQVAQAAAPLAEGEIRKVDKEAKKLTIKHGPIANLDMPAMTMVFQVKDPAILDQVKAGDKIKFAAENLGGAITVTKIEPSK